MKFQVVPKQNEDLNKAISESFETLAKTIKFLERLADGKEKKVSLPEIISDAVILYAKQGKSVEAIERLKLRIEMMEEFQFPELDVNPGLIEEELKVTVRIPGEDEMINFHVNIPKIDDSIDKLALNDAISQKLKKVTTTKSFLENELSSIGKFNF